MLPQTEEHQHRQFGWNLKAVMSFGYHLTQYSQGPSIASEMEAVEKRWNLSSNTLSFPEFKGLQRARTLFLNGTIQGRREEGQG